MKKHICGVCGIFSTFVLVLSMALMLGTMPARAQSDSPAIARTTIDKGTIKGGENRKGSVASGVNHAYTFRVERAANVIIDHMSDNSSLDAFLVLQSEQGVLIQDDDDGGAGLNSRIMRKLGAGNYRILAGGLGSSSGAYMLSVNLAEPKQFTLGSTVNGRLKDGGLDIYEFTLDREGLVRIDGKRTDDSDFSARMSLLSDSGEIIANDSNTCNSPWSELVRYLTPGNYQVMFTGSNNRGGSYSLSMMRKEFKAQEHTAISYGQARKGWIFPRQKHYYSFNVITGGHVQIDHMQDNSTLDAYLWLEDKNGMQIQSDDDGGDGLNSRIIRKLEPGSYKIIAGGLNESSGRYRLELRSIESKNIALNSTVLDFVDPNATKIYSFDIKQNMPVTLTCKRSGDTPFSPSLDLVNDQGMFVGRDMNQGNQEQSSIVQNLAPGVYQVYLRGYNNQGGQYVLSLKEGRIDISGGSGASAGKSIEIGKLVNGTLNNQETHVYNLSLKKDTFVTIDQMKDNSNLDSYLMLNSDDGSPIQGDDDGGGDLNSRIMRNLSAGKYQIVAGTYGGSSGAYKLIVNEMKVQQLSIGQPITDSLKVSEMKMYSFEKKAAGMVTILGRRLENSDLSPFIDLKQESGSGIARDYNYGNEPDSGISIYLPVGRYQIFLRGHNNTSGRYRLIVRDEK